MSDVFIFHFLHVIFDFVDADLRQIGKLNDHRFRRIVVVRDHDDQLLARWFAFARFIAEDGFELFERLIQLVLTDQIAAIVTHLQHRFANSPEFVRFLFVVHFEMK